jgi:hypothetical protein
MPLKCEEISLFVEWIGNREIEVENLEEFRSISYVSDLGSHAPSTNPPDAWRRGSGP